MVDALKMQQLMMVAGEIPPLDRPNHSFLQLVTVRAFAGSNAVSNAVPAKGQTDIPPDFLSVIRALYGDPVPNRLPDLVDRVVVGGQAGWRANPKALEMTYVIACQPPVDPAYSVSAPLIGMVVPFAGLDVPEGWLLCDGKSYSKEQYEELWNLLWFYRDGDTFAVPKLNDKRGVVGVRDGDLPGERVNGAVSGLTMSYIICTDGYIPEDGLSLSQAMTGEVVAWAGTEVPKGWLACDGKLVNYHFYPKLYNAIGTTWNRAGDKDETCRLPDLRGKMIVGGLGAEVPHQDLVAEAALG